MPGLTGLELLARIQSEYPDVPAVIITAFGTIQSAVEAMRAGAYDYLTKPIDYDELGIVVSCVIEHFRLVVEVQWDFRTSLDRKYGFREHRRSFRGPAFSLDTAARAARQP